VRVGTRVCKNHEEGRVSMCPLVVVTYLTHVRDLTDILHNKAHPDPLHGTASAFAVTSSAVKLTLNCSV